MTNAPIVSGVPPSSLFSRRKLPTNTRNECDAFITSRFSEEARPAPFQGYCSYTVLVGDSRIVQFRPPDHGLDVGIVSTACGIFGNLVPETELLSVLETSRLHVYSMRRLAGTSLSDLRASSAQGKITALRCQIMRDFARLQTMSWSNRAPGDGVRRKGTVGSSLRWRADFMTARLPARFRLFANVSPERLQDIENLPWVMSHGDFIPANVLVCTKTGRITGLLDWAEAEWLPFGVGLYGLEELLGEDTDGRFQYYPEAGMLRSLFWRELLSAIPELSRDADMLRLVMEAQILGILLWHGIAFDDGKLDRVVEAGVDDGEIQRLDVFLFHGPGIVRGQTLLEKL